MSSAGENEGNCNQFGAIISNWLLGAVITHSTQFEQFCKIKRETAKSLTG
jgi:hypothetical protein